MITNKKGVMLIYQSMICSLEVSEFTERLLGREKISQKGMEILISQSLCSSIGGS